jgi:hypothetical protein
MRQGRECVCAACAVSIPVAFWGLVSILLTLPLQPVRAQQSVDTTLPLSRTQADEQITSLLEQVQTLLDEGHVTSPAGGNASDTFSRALILSSFASPKGLQAMADFPSVLKKRSDAEQAAGHQDISMRYEIFAEVASSIIGSRGAKPNADSTAIPQVEPRPDATGPAKQETTAAATGHSDEGAVGDDRRRSAASQDPSALSAPAPSKAGVDVEPHLPMVPAQTKVVAPPGPRFSSQEALNASLDVGAPKSAGTTQVAMLPPAPKANAPPAHDNAGTSGPSQVPLLSSSMINALLEHGSAMLSIGDISAARLLFIRAAEAGSGKAAVALGDTYNPTFLADHNALGSLADPELAKTWYRKALALGEAQAKERLVDLGAGAQAEAAGSAHP